MVEEKLAENDEKFLWHQQETYKSMVSIPIECLKTLVLINGGAAVAVLTYAGNLVTKDISVHVYNISSSVQCYALGIFWALFGFVTVYKSKRFYFAGLAPLMPIQVTEVFTII